MLLQFTELFLGQQIFPDYVLDPLLSDGLIVFSVFEGKVSGELTQGNVEGRLFFGPKTGQPGPYDNPHPVSGRRRVTLPLWRATSSDEDVVCDVPVNHSISETANCIDCQIQVWTLGVEQKAYWEVQKAIQVLFRQDGFYWGGFNPQLVV